MLEKDIAELGPYETMIVRYPPTDPAPDLSGIPPGSIMARIYAKSLGKWNTHLHEDIRIHGRDCRCIGVIEIRHRGRNACAAILSPAD
jgi:hypothetical protein